MLHARALTVVTLTLLIAACAVGYPGKVIGTLDAPGEFCMGMTFDGSCLWVADYKADKLFKVDPVTGKTVGSIPSPGFWPAGLTFDGKHLWNADRKSAKIYKIDPRDGTILKVIDCPAKEPEGLAFDGTTVWVTDAKNARITKLDISDGTSVRTLTAPAGSPNGLTFDGKYLWCSDRTRNEIYMIEPDKGEVLVVLDSPGPYARGMAFDGENLWNVDHQNNKLYRLVLRDDEQYRLKDTRRATVTFTHQAKVYGAGKLIQLDAYIAVPADMPQQKILSTSFAPDSCNFLTDRWRQRVAAFSYSDIASEATLESTMVVEAEISAIQYFIFPELCATIDEIPPDIRERYTADGSKYMINDPYIRKIAKDVVGDERNTYYIARRIFDYVGKHIEYKLEGGWNAAPVVLKRGTGSCSEYSFCFIALCRAAGLPARYVGAIVVRGDDVSMDDVYHRWPEVYLANYGWVRFDAQAGDKISPRDRAMSIGYLANRYLITTQGGGDSEYLGWYYNSDESYSTQPQVQVNIESFGQWQPKD